MIGQQGSFGRAEHAHVPLAKLCLSSCTVGNAREKGGLLFLFLLLLSVGRLCVFCQRCSVRAISVSAFLLSLIVPHGMRVVLVLAV